MMGDVGFKKDPGYELDQWGLLLPGLGQRRNPSPRYLHERQPARRKPANANCFS